MLTARKLSSVDIDDLSSSSAAFADAHSSAAQARAAAAQRAELTAQYCEGSDEAFGQLYARTAPRVFAYLIILVRSRTTAEEILQVTFMKMHQSRSAYIRGADPLPWLFTIARRTWIDEVRRRKRLHVEYVPDAVPPDVPATGALSEEDAEPYTPELISAVLAALHRLPESQRDALLLTKIQGMSIADAAATLGTTPGAVKLRAHRAYVALRDVFKLE
jgi:RNA polymerase sigma-70 factor (ECF subfamily)